MGFYVGGLGIYFGLGLFVRLVVYLEVGLVCYAGLLLVFEGFGFDDYCFVMYWFGGFWVLGGCFVY